MSKVRVSWPLVGIAMGCILLCLAALVLAPRTPAGVPFSPHNAAPDGSRAVAQVLQRHGVHVRDAQNLDALAQGLDDPGATLVITDPSDLQGPDLDDVLHAASGHRIVVLHPTHAVRERLFADPAASARGEVNPAGADGQHIAINNSSILTNSGITDGPHAALALRALGHDDTLVWISDWQGRGGEKAARGLAWPAWKTPLIWALALTVGFLIVARGRRFGRLATEPLPVAVQSIESTRALATLYRRSKARDTAAIALQEASAARLARHLGLPRGSRRPTDVVAALGDHQEHAECLVSAAPATDPELIELAHQLATLEEEIIRDSVAKQRHPLGE